MARTATFKTNKDIVTALKNLEATSRFLKIQLVERGVLTTEDVKGEGRGRPVKNYVLTNKGRSLVALSKNWK